MLDKVKLLVACRYPKILTIVGKLLFFLLSFFVGKGHTAFLAKRRIGEHIIECFGWRRNQRIGG